MEVAVRQANRADAEQMLHVYNEFAKQFVGSASRTIKHFRRFLRKKDNINWVAVDGQSRVIGYVYARLDKRINRGEFGEIAVDPRYDFEHVAKPLVEKVNAVFMEKKVAAIIAGSLRNPAYEKLFPELGFSLTESNDVFMYAILDVQKFLNEVLPVFVNRLKRLENWKGLVQLECEGHSLFLQKSGGNVMPIVWTNQKMDFKVSVSRELLTKLIFGVVDPVELHRTGQIKVEASNSSKEANKLLRAFFPKLQFLLMDYW